MNKTLFSVSVKGIIQYNHRYLLRKNQRHEFELIGGRLESDDSSITHRLRIEFLEESQILVTNLMPREPWLYICGINNVIILPYTCQLYNGIIPNNMIDGDGGELCWFHIDELNSIPLPIGYYYSILGALPPKTYSPYIGKYPKIIPNYKDALYNIKINLYNIYYNKIFSKYLEHFISPRETIEEYMGTNYYSQNIVSIKPELNNNTVELNYVLLSEEGGKL